MNKHINTQISKTGRIIIPKEFRDNLQLLPGTDIFILQNGEEVILIPADVANLSDSNELTLL